MRKGEWWLNSMKRGRPSLQRWSTQQGQAFLFIVILIAFFLLAVLGLATDYTQVWAHRQMAQGAADAACEAGAADVLDRKSTRLNSSHGYISYAVFCLKKI